jgi:hypothetical protein
MSPSLEYLETCSTQTGYQVAPLEKVVRLGELAADVARHPFFPKTNNPARGLAACRAGRKCLDDSHSIGRVK